MHQSCVKWREMWEKIRTCVLIFTNVVLNCVEIHQMFVKVALKFTKNTQKDDKVHQMCAKLVLKYEKCMEKISKYALKLCQSVRNVGKGAHMCVNIH